MRLTDNAIQYTISHLLKVAFPHSTPDIRTAEGQFSAQVEGMKIRFFLMDETTADALSAGTLELKAATLSNGLQVPLYRQSGSDALYCADGDTLTLHCDLVTLPFLLLSRWEEYQEGKPRDAHGRFVYAGSLNERYGLIDLPVADLYALLLRQWVCRHYGITVQPRQPRCISTHDVDLILRFGDRMKSARTLGADLIKYHSIRLFRQSHRQWRRFLKDHTTDPLIQACLRLQLYDKERLAAAEESAARFHEQEQQYALEKEQARHKRDLLIQISLIVIALLISLVTFLIFYQWRITRRKNALLSKEIAQNIDYKMRYFRMSHPEQTAEVKDDKSVPQLSTMSNAELFEFLHVVITGEQLYLNPLFDRQYLMDRFGLSKEHVGAAFSQGSPYASLADYVNECRLSYSTLLLSNRPDMSIAEVASASGFSNASVFARNFKQRYTMTPTEFRNKEN